MKVKNQFTFKAMTVIMLLCLTLVSAYGNLNRAYPHFDNIKLVGTDGSETVYENGDDGTASKWLITGSVPGAEVINVYDSETVSQVIEIRDNATNSRYMLTNGLSTAFTAGAWKNTTQKVLQFDVNSYVAFEVLVLVNTVDGFKYLYYTTVDADKGFLNWGNGYVHHGIGSYIVGNGWITVTLDLQSDLNEYIPGLAIDSVYYFAVKEIGDYIPPEPPAAEAHTIGFWKNNIKKALAAKPKGFQIDKATLEGYVNAVGQFYSSVFANLTMEEAYEVLNANDSNPVVLLKKQLLASELSYMNGARLLNDEASTVAFLREGEDLLLNPAATAQELLALKDKFDAFNNNEIVELF